MAVEIKSYNQILGEMVRKIIADTPLNDINTGSTLLTLLEAAAQADFENNASILNVLELLNIDAVRNNDLDARAADFGLVRIPAQRATGFVQIGDSNITKRSTGLYQVKPAPIAGSTQIFVNDASDWAATGQLFIGRGTANFEGPIGYTSIVNNGSFFTINLASSLEKDHLVSESVIDGQGTSNRLISAGTIVQIPANNLNPAIEYRIVRDAVIPAGEDLVTNVEIAAINAGTKSNAGINTIVAFASPPFSGATVSNTTALTNGTDVETDDELRERVKSYANTLARGTESAILSAVIGVSDPDDGKQVASAVITEPPKVGDPSILYIDDGSGFQPSFAGQSVDVLLNSASGDEQFLQLSNFPLPRPQVTNTAEGPYELTDQMILRVLVDGIEESVIFEEDDFTNIASATLAEIITRINDVAETFSATFTDNSSRILLFPVQPDVETIQVAPLRSTDNPNLFANNILKFPNNEFSYIRLYKNDTLLSEKERAATLQTNTFNTWNITTSGNLIISVDGTPPQDRSFDSSDFENIPFASLSLQNWVDVFNAKFAGITASATSSGRLQIVSNKEGLASQLTIVGGSYFDKLFANQDIISTGKNSDFQLNRQNGNLRILTEIESTDSITAGTTDAKGQLFSSSTPTGTYNLNVDADGREAQVIVAADSSEVILRVGIGLAIGNIITITDEGNNVMRLTSDSASSFAALVPGDFLYIADRGAASAWIDPANTGIYHVIAKGDHVTANVDTYVEVKNVNIVAGAHTVLASEDIQGFKSYTYPQLWKASFLPTPASSTIRQVVDSFIDNIVNINSSVFKTSSIKLTSSTENTGTIATPAGSGVGTTLFPLSGHKDGNESFIATRIPDKDFVSYFKRTIPTSTDADGVPGKTVWLDRVQYSDVKGDITADAEPGEAGVDTYSEVLESTGALTPQNVEYDDILNYLTGANKGHYRTVRDKLAVDTVGTQHALPRTLMDIPQGDKFNLVRAADISPDDNIVFILDQDAVAKTIDVRMSRTGQVNSLFPPTTLAFSGNDADNEPGITFSSLQVWGKNANNTEFKDYAVWMRARNWYTSGGAGSGGGSFMVRSKEFGPHGEQIRFRLEYPSTPARAPLVSHDNNPDFTLLTYYFGSDVAIPTGISAGNSFTVTDLGGDIFRYSFLSPIALGAVTPGMILSFLSTAGVSAANAGQFSILAVDDFAKTIDVYNPNGTETIIGNPEITDVTTVDDVVGSQTVSTVSNIAAAAGLDGQFFVINDAAGSVGIYYDVGTPNPGAGALGVNRTLTVTLTGAEAANTVASLTSGIITADTEFSCIAALNSITITNTDNGAYGVAADGGTPTGFTFSGTAGTADVTIDGTYFTLQDQNGSVAFWYDLSGTTSEPLHGATRSVEITTVNYGDSAATIATKTAVVVAGDAQFASATVGGSTITITDVTNGARSAASAGTSGFTVVENTAGVDDVPETIAIPTSMNIYPLIGTNPGDIVGLINLTSSIAVAAVIDDATDIVKATREDVYTPVGPGDYSASLAHGHDPDPGSGENSFVRFYDGINWVKDFENLHPNFSLKKTMALPGSASSSYELDTTPNEDGSQGEYFRLVPVTLNNLYHHFTQKALSQLPIVADIDISSNIRRIQVKSKLLGSQGAVEVVGGNANQVDFSIFGEASVTPGIETGNNLLEVKTRAFPTTLTKGMLVKVTNDNPTKRASTLASTDTIDVFKDITDNAEYRWNPKATNLGEFVRFAITDASATYARPAGTVWRWTHNDGGSVFRVQDKTLGAPANPANDYEEDGLTFSSILQTEIVDPGTATTEQELRLTVSSLPAQAEYFTFESADTNTFAIWFDVDANGTAPTGAQYLAATHKIEVDILSTDTEDQIISKLAATLIADVNFLSSFDGAQLEGANLDDVVPGDLLHAYGTFPAAWSSGNKSKAAGDGNVAGLPIIAVDSLNRWVDVVNPSGVAMTEEAIGTGSVNIAPTPIVKWNFTHVAPINIVQINLSGGTGTVITTEPHGLREGDSFIIQDNGLAQTATVVSVPSHTNLTFTDGTAATDGQYFNGTVIADGKVPTKYKIESIGFNGIMRLVWAGGEEPRFVDNGAAVDDILVIQGTTFDSNNTGNFRVLGVDNRSILFQSAGAREELNTIIPFNNLETPVNWTANADFITGVAGAFKNLTVGSWVKKPEDDDSLYKQVVEFLDGSGFLTTPDLAVRVNLGAIYDGTTSTTLGISFDQANDVGGGVFLESPEDIQMYEGDAVRVGDTIFIDDNSDDRWFSPVNTGTYEIIQFGTHEATHQPFVRVENPAGITETNRELAVDTLGYFIAEGPTNLYESVRLIEHTMIDGFNEDRRSVYLSPATKVDKMSISNGTKIEPIGKMSYSEDVTTGIDGYTYYTGLLRTVQRIIDGYEPESNTYPGRRAVGGLIEILPPLIRQVSVSIDVTTNEGVNLNEISNDIKSSIIDYIDSLGVGQDVILAEMVVAVMDITGVEAITFNEPDPSIERIAIADNEKAFITPDDISVS
jgi:uncharacterized phage protein gp47/JayE